MKSLYSKLWKRAEKGNQEARCSATLRCAAHQQALMIPLCFVLLFRQPFHVNLPLPPTHSSLNFLRTGNSRGGATSGGTAREPSLLGPLDDQTTLIEPIFWVSICFLGPVTPNLSSNLLNPCLGFQYLFRGLWPPIRHHYSAVGI